MRDYGYEVDGNEGASRALVEALSEIALFLDDACHTWGTQPSWAAYTGQEAASYDADGWRGVVHPDDVEALDIAWGSARRTAAPVSVACRLFHTGSNEYRRCEGRLVPYGAVGTPTLHWVLGLTDVHERALRDEREQRNAERFLRFVDSNVVAIGYGRGDKIVDGNRAFLDLLRARRSDLEDGLAISQLLVDPPDTAHPAFASDMSCEYEVRRLDGTRGVLLAAGVDLAPEPGWLTVAIDITERTAAEQHIRHLALHDPLTGLANRRLLLDRLTHALARASRTGQLLAVLFCDLDGFKRLNDTYGHSTGDRVLEIVGRRLHEFSRETDTVARNGGDEFIVVVEDIEDERQAIRIAERLRSSLSRPMSLADGDVRVGCSIGAVVTHGIDVDAEALLTCADAAMYEAKRVGGNRVAAVTSDTLLRAGESASEPRRIDNVSVAVPQTEAQLFVLDLDPTHASIRAARRAIEQWAHDVGAGSAAETAKLLVSELATNAVTHARTPFTVRATWHPPYVRIEVVDAAPLPDLDVPRASRLGGWGFEFLDRFSHSWGIEERDTNKAVWFDVHIATHALTPLPDHPTQHSEAQHHSPERIVA